MATYSFVIPVYNEEDVLVELHRRLSAVAGRLNGQSEFILVDDGSSDRSREVMTGLREGDARVKLLFLSRNFGHQLAISAGLDHAAGDAVIVADADLQDPPEVVPEMVALWREGYEVVHGIRRRRAGESRFKLWTAHLFYRLLRKFSDLDLPLDAGDFRLVDRRVADAVRTMREPDRYLRGLFAWTGFRQTSVAYDRDRRFAGETKNSLARMVHFAVDGVMSFSTALLRLILAMGLVVSALSFAMGIVAIAFKLAGALSVPGWASLTVLVSFVAGFQLVVLGILGLYVGRIYEQGKHRPLYLVAEGHGFDSGPQPADHVLRAQGYPAEPALDPPERR